MKTIEQLTAAYEKGMLQDAVVLWRWLKKNGKSMADVEKYLAEIVKTAGKPKDQPGDVTIMKCPECEGPMFLFPVNTGPRDQVDGNYHSQWVCRNPKCMHTKFNVSTKMEILERIKDVELKGIGKKKHLHFTDTVVPKSKCPLCGAMRYLYTVNTSKEDQVGGLHKSQWVCPNKECGFEEFSPKSNEELMEGLEKE